MPLTATECLFSLLLKVSRLQTRPPEVAATAELVCIICLSYATFLVAEYARLSGIVAALFAGAVCVMYVKRNMTVQGAELSGTVIHALAKFADTAVFILIG